MMEFIKQITQNLGNPNSLVSVLLLALKYKPEPESEEQQPDPDTNPTKRVKKTKKSASKIEKTFRNSILRGIHTLLNAGEIDKTIQVLDTMDSTGTTRTLFHLPNEQYSLNSLKIKAFCQKKERLEDAVMLAEQIPNQSKRIYLPILMAFHKWKTPTDAFGLLVKMETKPFRLDLDDLQGFLTESFDTKLLGPFCRILFTNEIVLLKPLIPDSPVVTIGPDGRCPHTGAVLQRQLISTKLMGLLQTEFQREYIQSESEKNKAHMTTFLQYLKKREGQFNTFVDGNNILFYKRRQVTYHSFLRLRKIHKELVATGKKPLIIIHRRHRDHLEKNISDSSKVAEIRKILGSMEIYFTPYGMNDDLFFIWAAMNTEKSFIVSNDNLRDHIFKIDDDNLKSWLKRTVVKYDTVEKPNLILETKFEFPEEITFCAQFVDGHWFVPISGDNGEKKWNVCSV